MRRNYVTTTNRIASKNNKESMRKTLESNKFDSTNAGMLGKLIL